MGSIYQEFEKQLEAGQARWAGDPRKEMLHLFLLALEREEIVAVGYRETAIARRLAAMPISPDIRDILRHALVWAWKDEEMHAIYIRGAILHLGGPWLKLTAYLRQLGGGVGGWASSVLMHARWRDAPFSRILARTITTIAGAFGRVPAAVRASLENIYDQFYDNRDVASVAGYFGFDSPSYSLIDSSKDQAEHRYSRGMAQYTVSGAWKDADFRISLGKMRSHPVEVVYLTLGNVEWLGARCDQFLFSERQAQRETAIMMILDACPPHFAVLEAWNQVPDGLVGVMGCPRPQAPLRFYAGIDALSVDIVAARHLGLRNPRESSMLRAAHHWFGADQLAPRVSGPDDAIDDWRSPYHNELWAFLSLVSYPIYVLGSGRGALFVPEMDEDAFPQKVPPSLTLRAARRSVRALLGLRHAR